MGLIDLYKFEYIYNFKTRENELKIVWNGLSPTNTFLDSLRFKKVYMSFKCHICKKEKPKNTRYLGENYKRVCCDCSPEWIKNSIQILNEIIELLNSRKGELNLNKDKWRKEMIFGALQ